MAKYKVTAAAAVVKVSDQRRQVYVYRGATLPPNIVAGEAERLIKRGLVVEVPAPAPSPDQVPVIAEPAPDEVPAGDATDTGADLDGMTVDDLREYAAVSDIALNGATRKADIIAAIRAAETE